MRCSVDQGSVLDYASGGFEATVSWQALATR
jgi:hypothetical protein